MAHFCHILVRGDDKVFMKKGYYFPIILKLIILIVGMLLSVTVLISYKNAELFETISTDREEAVNLKFAETGASEVETLIQSYVDKINFYSIDLIKNNQENISSEQLLSPDSEILGLSVFKQNKNSNSNDVQSLNLINNKISIKDIELKPYLEGVVKTILTKNALIFQGKIQVLNLSKLPGVPMIGVGVPLIKNENGEISSIAWGFVKIDRLQKSFSTRGERLVFAVDSDGKVLAHPEEKYVLRGKDLLAHSVVKDAMNSTIRVKQKYFDDKNLEEKILGAFSKTSSDLIIISQTPMSLIYAPSLLVKQTSYYILGIALSFSLFFIFLFSLTLTSPIEKLLGLTKEIAAGNFNIEAKKIVSSSDEVGLLANAFDEMTIGLKERDKMKNLFDKFHGTAVTDELLKNEINLGGKRKEVTVFFSDIRGFTQFSEGHTPEEVVSMLNEYFEVMVGIINRNNGVVDKFIGDAIMAIWGVPHESDEDAKMALNATLEMRVALNVLNESRIDRGLVPIKIGMGLHSGEAISGQIGSSERMEFTVIGDTVNTASRIEGSTKTFGTDLLLSDEVVKRIGANFLIEEAGKVQVQGKEDSLLLYKVNGVVEEGVERLIKTPYSSYEAIEDKKSKIAS